MRTEYPLTAAQNMHYQWIREYKTQQVSGVSIVASLQVELDFGLLKKCIQMEMERYGCLRLRFTKPDAKGNIKQYLAGSLYNAPFTINPYYTAQANYDTDGALDGESSYREQYYGGADRGSGSDDPYEYLCANL